MELPQDIRVKCSSTWEFLLPDPSPTTAPQKAGGLWMWYDTKAFVAITELLAAAPSS